MKKIVIEIKEEKRKYVKKQKPEKTRKRIPGLDLPTGLEKVLGVNQQEVKKKRK